MLYYELQADLSTMLPIVIMNIIDHKYDYYMTILKLI